MQLRAQRRALTPSLTSYERRHDRDEAMARAYLSGLRHTLVAIAGYFSVHSTAVSRAVSGYENMRT
jgi:hypothetical protein